MTDKITLEDMYCKTHYQRRGCEIMLRTMETYSNLDFWFPNKEKAPWHIMCKVSGQYETLVNFWPHKMKAQAEHSTVYQSETAFIDAIEDAFDIALDTVELIDEEDV